MDEKRNPSFSIFVVLGNKKNNTHRGVWHFRRIIQGSIFVAAYRNFDEKGKLKKFDLMTVFNV